MGYLNAALDADGDVWALQADGTWCCLTASSGACELAELAKAYGPLRFADPLAAAPVVRETYMLRLQLRDGELARVLTEVTLNGATYVVRHTNTVVTSRNPEQFPAVAVISPYIQPGG